jgi:phosphoglycerate dehydrogenase-like enzyme
MANHTVLVMSSPTDPYLKMLDELPPETTLAVGETVEAFDRSVADATVLFNWMISRDLMRELMVRSPKLEWIHSRAAGLDHILCPELVESNVTLTNGSGVFSQSLGEFVLAGILYFAKDFRRMVRSQMAGKWDQFDVLEISGKTLGIVGYGDIGRAIATRARAMGMRVLAVKRKGPPLYNVDPLVTKIYSPGDRIEMIKECDYIAVSAPMTPETKGLIGEAEFAAMKPDAVILNVGRGPVIDEQAMIRALTEGRIKGAALDVFEREPLPEGHPFYKLENVLLSPHTADHTPDWIEQAMRFFVEQFQRYASGVPLKNVVDKKLGY